MSPADLLEGLGFGAFVGLALGSLGAGGSILTVPILVYAMGVPVQIATGTSLAIVGLNALAGALMHLRRRRALPRVGLGVGVSGLAGALGGAWLNHQVRGDVVLILFACLMVLVAVGLLRRYPAVVTASVSAECITLASWARVAAVGLGVGLLTGFFGVGGGFLIVPALVLILGLPMSLAVGTSLLAIALNALWGLLAHLSFGALDLPLTAIFVVGGMLGLVLGGHLAGRMPEHQLRLSFGVVVLATAAYTRPQRRGTHWHRPGVSAPIGARSMHIQTLRTPGLGDTTYALTHQGLAIVVSGYRPVVLLEGGITDVVAALSPSRTERAAD